MSSMDRFEHKALKLIFEAGDEGLLQTELWEQLSTSSREGSRIARSLEEKGKIVREKFLSDGHWTYKLHFLNPLITLDSIEGCPCLLCSDIEKCFHGGVINPNVCIMFTAWIDPRIEQTKPQIEK